MAEEKDASQTEIGGYPIIRGSQSIRTSDRQVFFVDASNDYGSLKEAAAKVGPKTRSARRAMTREARYTIAAKRGLPPDTENAIPQVLDYTDEEGRHVRDAILVTEKIGSGKTLENMIKTKGGLGVAETLRVLSPVAVAIDTSLKSNGMIHRDLKPSNIFLDDDGIGKLADFGATVTMGYIDPDGMVDGTPGYFSPEHARGDIAMPSINIWGFGAIAFYAITGRHLMERDTNTRSELFFKRDDYEKYIDGRMKGVPGTIQKVIKTAVAFDPGDRYTSCGDIMRDLAEIDQSFQQGHRGKEVRVSHRTMQPPSKN